MLSMLVHLQVEVYADPTARAGVLEPEGIVEIKFREPDLLAAMQRIDPELQRLKADGQLGAARERQKQLLPVYHQVRSAP